MHRNEDQRLGAWLTKIMMTSPRAQEKITFFLQKPHDSLTTYSRKHEAGPLNGSRTPLNCRA